MIKGKPMTEDVPVETFTGLYTESEMNNIKDQSNVFEYSSSAYITKGE